jgi:hypothetical protein
MLQTAQLVLGNGGNQMHEPIIRLTAADVATPY